MENYLSDAFVTGLSVGGGYETTAFRSDTEEQRRQREICRKDEKLNGGKLDDDIVGLEGKIYRHINSINPCCYVTEKALENLALDKESLQLDLPYLTTVIQ